ncbi:MAG TPA: PEP-CTERM sorting domain-containing protein [Candidatus Limnocylindria bacterium]|nr:PEP-CTERM sorting domain-containing protein [Candidatus Limnocylindria bacterium]
MKDIRVPVRFLLPLLYLLAMAAPVRAQHFNAGAITRDQGAQLYWANGAAFAASSGYVQSMTFADSGTYANYYGSGLSLTALPTTVANGGPVAGSAALSSFISVRMTLFSAPEGASFAFWDTGSLTPTYNLSAGGTSPMWALSDASLGAGQLDGDPYGHIHGRRFTATMPGAYSIGFELFDTSGNGIGGDFIHPPSDMFTMNFQAVPVPEPSTFAMIALGGGIFVAMACMSKRRN